jgi:RNA polymerase sigma factor for flagellar operon FliA
MSVSSSVVNVATTRSPTTIARSIPAREQCSFLTVNSADRARLVESHLELPRRAAAMIFRRVRTHVELAELVALGNAGLAEAAQRYDPDRGATFATFAWYRVQGAILDGLRRSANLPRRTWARLIALRAASDYLEHRAERDRGAALRGVAPPDGGEALERVKDALSAIRTMYVTSLESLREDAHETADEAPAPDTLLTTGRLGAKLRQALDALPERERAIVTKHYWEGKNLLEAGAELGISKSWASRLHAQAVERLRAIVDS